MPVLVQFIGLMSLLFSGTSLAMGDLPLSERTVVTLFGDSITVGFSATFRDRDAGGTISRGCPTLYLNNLLRNEGDRGEDINCSTTAFNSPIFDANRVLRNAIVNNWGEGGTSTERGVERMGSHLGRSRRDFPGGQYITLIMYGTNDRNARISSTTTGLNIRDMVIEARRQGFRPIVSNLTPRDDQNVLPYNTEIETRARAEGAAFVDIHSRFINHPNGGFKALIPSEASSLTGEQIRLHPNDNGYLVIAETWFDQQLKNLIPVVESNQNRFNLAPIVGLILED